MSPWRPARPARLHVSLLAVLALLLQTALPPVWNPLRDDPFVRMAGLCGPGHGAPGIPPRQHDHANCPACQPGPVPLLLPPEPASLPVPLRVAAAGQAPGPRIFAPRPASPYASRAPPQAIG